jgi:hypothetical protein
MMKSYQTERHYKEHTGMDKSRVSQSLLDSQYRHKEKDSTFIRIIIYLDDCIFPPLKFNYRIAKGNLLTDTMVNYNLYI